MKRELKFRAWYINKYIDGIMYYFGLGQDYFKFSAIDNETGESADWTFELDDAKAIMQYTGCKDKNGKEIYEGDIVYMLNSMDNSYEEVKWGGYNDGEYLFSCECWMVDHIPLSDVHNGTWGHSAYVVEVVGNVFENPELLK